MTDREPSSQEKMFADLFDAEYDFVHHSLRRLGVPTRDLEDVAHDTFMKVYENLARYDPTRPVRPWLFAFAFRFASDYRRLARHRIQLGAEPDDLVSSQPTAEDLAARREAGAIAEAAILTIPVEQRAVFLLHELDETPMKAIAEHLEIPINTGYSRLRLAREAFAAAIARFREEGSST